MKLLFAIKSLNVRGGGAERVLVEVANGLIERGHDITIMTFDKPGTSSFYQLNNKIGRLDLSVGPPGYPTPRVSLLRAIPKMRRALQHLLPDLAVGFMHSMYVPLGIAMFHSDIPLIASEHIGSAHFKRRLIQCAMVRIVSHLFAIKTVPSEAIRHEHRIKEQKKVIVLPNPINVKKFWMVQSHIPEMPPIILSVGRLMAQKNHADLIAAFAQLTQTYPDWRLRIVGDGVLRSEIETQIKKYDLAERIELPGMVRDIASEYARAAIVVVPSRYESFGMVTAEAQAAGRPVIGFADCPGTNDLICDGENGLLVSSEGDRVANLAAGIERLITDATLRRKLGSAGPSSVQKFALESVLDVWEQCFLSNCRTRQKVISSHQV